MYLDNRVLLTNPSLSPSRTPFQVPVALYRPTFAFNCVLKTPSLRIASDNSSVCRNVESISTNGEAQIRKPILYSIYRPEKLKD
jgi:hypothetical protein